MQRHWEYSITSNSSPAGNSIHDSGSTYAALFSHFEESWQLSKTSLSKHGRRGRRLAAIQDAINIQGGYIDFRSVKFPFEYPDSVRTSTDHQEAWLLSIEARCQMLCGCMFSSSRPMILVFSPSWVSFSKSPEFYPKPGHCTFCPQEIPTGQLFPEFPREGVHGRRELVGMAHEAAPSTAAHCKFVHQLNSEIVLSLKIETFGAAFTSALSQFILHFSIYFFYHLVSIS